MSTDYTLDTGKLYIREVFAPERFYNIPDYQRPYVWDREQIETLLEDLFTAFQAETQREYFLGCMIWNTKTNANKVQSQDILDGQQRFLTLFLLHAVIRDLSDNQKLKGTVTKRLIQEEQEFDGIPQRQRVEFEIRSDNDFIQDYVLTEGGTLHAEALLEIVEDSEEKSVRNMARALGVLHQWWGRRKQEDAEGFQELLNQFFRFLSQSVLVLYLATPDNLDDAYNLFTVLNSRGMQLQAGDILRAQNLRAIDDATLRKQSAEAWNQYESAVKSPFKHFDDFLWALVYIKMKYSSDDNKSLSHAFAFMDRRKLLPTGKSMFDFVGQYVGHYQAVQEAEIATEQYGKLFANLITILNAVYGNTYMAPLMHYRACFGEYRMVEFLLKLENLLTMAWLLGKRGNTSRNFILLRKMDELFKDSKGPQQAADRLLDHEVLAYGYDDPKSSTRLDSEAFWELLQHEPFGTYSGTKVNKIRYLLLKLDLLTGPLDTQMRYNRQQVAVEQLMPPRVEGTSWKVESSFHQEWTHRLGNLVLIDRLKNANLTALDYAQKKERYRESIHNRAHTEYVFRTYPNWGRNELIDHHDQVVALLRRYYEGDSLETMLSLQKEATASRMAG